MKANSQITGNMGLYYACYKLSCLGWNVIPTARNARGVDIILYSQDGKVFRGIQVKTLSKRSPVPLGTSLDKLMGDFWVIVVNPAGQPKSFILTPEEVIGGAHKGVGATEDKVSFWLQPKDYEKPHLLEAWDRIQPDQPGA